MGRVLLSTGEYATTPYCFDNLGIRVCSAEELCYVLKENAFLLDVEIMNKRLVRWIDEVLGLPDLAGQLYPLINRKVSVGIFVAAILRYVGFYEEETIVRIEEIYKTGADLNIYEKLKNRTDHMVAEGRYATAITEYDSLLEQLPEEEKQLRAAMLHNKGVALCGMFYFNEAAQAFGESFEIVPDTEVLTAYLAAKRMSMNEGEYVAFVAGVPDYYAETLEVESRVENLRREWEESPAKKQLAQRLTLKEEGDMAAYFEETDKWVRGLKNSYRETILN